MHASLFCAAITLLPLSLAAPPRPPFYTSNQIGARQDEASGPTTPDSPDTSSCDLSYTSQPDSSLEPPPADTQLVMIALGRGSQNYTCSDPSSAPSPIGAVAQLFDASCEISADPEIPTAELDFVDESSAIGDHFFVDNTTPDFDIVSLGNTQAKKIQDADAPQPASDVKWLRLERQAQGTTSTVRQIYRLNTVGGVAPATCEGREAGEVVTVEYQAQYWVYA